MNTKENGFAYSDGNSHTYIFLGTDRRGRLEFITQGGDRVLRLIHKSKEFEYLLRPSILGSPKCLYYLDLKQCLGKLLKIYPEENSVWRADARRKVYEILGKRMLRVDFENPKEPRKYKKKDKTGLVSLQQICAELGYDDMEVRKFLRETMRKPGGRWEWPEAEVENVKKTIKGFFS